MANEKRLIYLEDAIALFEKDIAENKDALKTAYPSEKTEIRGEMTGVRAAIHILKHHASHGGTVDAVEVVHGHWCTTTVEAGDPYDGNSVFCFDVFQCSVCGECFDVSDAFNYCPNCGAKMDGDGNG